MIFQYRFVREAPLFYPYLSTRLFVILIKSTSDLGEDVLRETCFTEAQRTRSGLICQSDEKIVQLIAKESSIY